MRLFGFIATQFTITIAFVVYELGTEPLPEHAFGGLFLYLLAGLLTLAAWQPWRRP